MLSGFMLIFHVEVLQTENMYKYLKRGIIRGMNRSYSDCSAI